MTRRLVLVVTVLLAATWSAGQDVQLVPKGQVRLDEQDYVPIGHGTGQTLREALTARKLTRAAFKPLGQQFSFSPGGMSALHYTGMAFEGSTAASRSTGGRIVLVINLLPEEVRETVAVQLKDVTVVPLALLMTWDEKMVTIDVLNFAPGQAVANYNRREMRFEAPEDGVRGEGDCWDCLLEQLKKVPCELLALAISCAPEITCPGAVLKAIVDYVLSEVVGSICDYRGSLVECQLSCMLPKVTVTPPSGAVIPPGPNTISVTATAAHLLAPIVGAIVFAGSSGELSSLFWAAHGVLPTTEYTHEFTGWSPLPNTLWTVSAMVVALPIGPVGFSLPAWSRISTNIRVEPQTPPTPTPTATRTPTARQTPPTRTPTPIIPGPSAPVLVAPSEGATVPASGFQFSFRCSSTMATQLGVMALDGTPIATSGTISCSPQPNSVWSGSLPLFRTPHPKGEFRWIVCAENGECSAARRFKVQ